MAALGPQPKSTNPFASSYSSPKDDTKDEWEDWEVDSDVSESTSGGDGILIDLSGNDSGDRTRKSYKPANSRLTQRRSVQLPRVKSRARQKAQNAKAGIKLVTDMSQFQQAQQAGAAANANKGRFADSPALRALEGNPSSASIGSFAWLKRKPGNSLGNGKSMLAAEDHSADLSPNARPIVIGISVPSDDAGSHQVSPQTAVIETPIDMQYYSQKAGGKAQTPQQLRSVWSPDTEVSESPQSSRRAVSSVYSQYTPFEMSRMATDAPPVPALPATIKFQQTGRIRDHDEDDSGTPCTPFEEDGSPVVARKAEKPKQIVISRESTSSRAHGWWDHVTTPFTPQSSNPFKTQPQQTGSTSTSGPHEWWGGHDEKAGSSSKASHLTISIPGNQEARETSGQSHSEKGRILLEENRSNTSNDAPPPYEYSKSQGGAKVAYSHPYINPQPIPSPGPMTPGLPGTMTSQRGINLADIPLTPSGVRPVPSAVLPDRAVGSYRTGDQFYEARGKSNKTERKRRRHEKEDVIARRIGGYWRGRGCIPEEGCFGRTGREGRKRRRICLGIFGGIIAAIILIVVLVVVLTKRAMSPATGDDGPGSVTAPGHHGKHPPPDLRFLNLTDFPPMPTGVLTVAGPNNTVAVSGCFTDEKSKTPSTAWSCALPKEDHDSVSPYNPSQPEFIFQIQFDNDTRALWKLADEAEEPGNDRRGFVTDAGFEPEPAPPSLAEMRFLGNTTDDIKADKKEGEPTPFFISLLKSVDALVGPNVLERRQGNAIGGSGGNGTAGFNFSDILPAPDLNPDGRGAAARLFPLPAQQPVRLFDRGLPTEHYGFYTYFDKKIYMVDIEKREPVDEDGGVPIEDANWLVTFAQTRFLVQIWTRLGNTTHLLGDGDRNVNLTATPAVQPGSMPYPVTISEDMHGGDQSKKIDFAYGVKRNGEIDRANAKGIVADLTFKGTLVNGRNSHANLALGGVDGGTGGCRCEWVNFERD